MLHARQAGCSRSAHGYTLIEVLFVSALAAVVAAAALPQLTTGLQHMKAVGAARYLSARLQQARMEAMRRRANTALRFTWSGGGFRYAAYVDGNRNGVRAADILAGVDRQVGHEERLSDQFAGVWFGALPGLPAVDAGGQPPGNDPIRFGAADMATFTASGTATPGSLYIRGPAGTQYVIRVFGDTGRTRILKFHPVTQTWRAL